MRPRIQLAQSCRRSDGRNSSALTTEVVVIVEPALSVVVMTAALPIEVVVMVEPALSVVVMTTAPAPPSAVPLAVMVDVTRPPVVSVRVVVRTDPLPAPTPATPPPMVAVVAIVETRVDTALVIVDAGVVESDPPIIAPAPSVVVMGLPAESVPVETTIVLVPAVSVAVTVATEVEPLTAADLQLATRYTIEEDTNLGRCCHQNR